MKDFLAWILENEDWLKELGRIILSLCAFLYTGVVHSKSKKRLSELEAKSKLESNIASQLEELKSALKERSK